MGRTKIHVQPPKQVKVFAEDANRIIMWQGKLGLAENREVSRSEVVSKALDALERNLEEGAHVTG